MDGEREEGDKGKCTYIQAIVLHHRVDLQSSQNEIEKKIIKCFKS